MMRRPNVVADRMAAQNAVERQRRRAQLDRRAAAARRRLALTMFLLAATLGGGIAAAVSSLSVFFVAIPAVLTASVLVLGRRAVVLNERADARYERLQDARAQDLEAATNAEQAPAVEVEAPVEVEEPIVEEAVAEVEEVGETWTPVPVPAPTYTLKPTAPRMEPAPLELPEYDYLAASAKTSDETAPAAQSHNGAFVAEPAAAAAEADLDLDLDAILDRRRAAGA